jgi:hypothetical protein
MKCGIKSKSDIVDDKEYQDLSGWEGVSLDVLLSKLQGETNDEVRVYTVQTTNMDQKFKIIRHMGSGPNLEGGLATLCTCKHSMRQGQTEWKGKWILGLTSRAVDKGFNGEHYLFYLMKVERHFKSHKEIFEHLKQTNPDALRIKNAVKNRLGDIFEPVSNCTNPHDPNMYKTPHKRHSHGANGSIGWHKDIISKGGSAQLLIGENNNTFVWPRPMIRFNLNRGPGNMKLTLGEDLFSHLETV